MTSSSSQTPPNGTAQQSQQSQQSQDFDPAAFDASLFGLSPVQPQPRSSSSRKNSYPPRGGRQITRNRASYSCHTCRRRKVKCDKVRLISHLPLQAANISQVHPICGNCLKTGSECVYDSVPKNTRDGLDDRGNATKRRRESSKRPERGDSRRSITSLSGRQDSHYGGHNGDFQDHKSNPQAIEARLDRLTSMVESLSRANGPQGLQDDGSTPRQDHGEDAETRELKLGLEKLEGSIRNTANSRPCSRSRQQTPGPHIDANTDDFPIPAGLSTDIVDPVGTLNMGHLSLEDGGRSR